MNEEETMKLKRHLKIVMPVKQIQEDVIDAIEELTPDELLGFANSMWIRKQASCFYLAGNGGSAMNAGHFAEDLESIGYSVKWLGANPGRTLALMNDKPREDFFTLQMQNFTRHDSLVVFTVHGGTGGQEAGKWSQNILKAADLCLKRGGKLFVFSGLNGGYLGGCVEASFIKCESGEVKVVEPFHDAAFHMILNILEKLEELNDN